MTRNKSTFRFKQFNVRHQNSIMKVGTDGVLLGAWVAQDYSPANILDVGTGSGLMALMLAQRFRNIPITGIDIHKESVSDAVYNRAHLPFDHLLTFEEKDFLEYTPASTLDLIVSNPPYFASSLLSDKKEKNTARHQLKLTAESFLKKAVQILNKSGKIALILPAHEMEKATKTAEINGLFLEKTCEISSFKESPVIRIMAEFSFRKAKDIRKEKLFIYDSEKEYSDKYRTLTKEFYLNF